MRASGSFLSRVFDGSVGINWENIAWTADLPAGTSLAIAVRTGNTAIPDSTWTPFTTHCGAGRADAEVALHPVPGASWRRRTCT